MVGNIAIVGAGPGGLVAAVAAGRAGLQVNVFEQNDRLKGPGGSWILNANGLRVLDHLGLRDACSSLSFDISRLALKRADGTMIAERTVSCGAVACIELLELLAQSAQAAGAKIHFGRRLDGLDQSCDDNLLRFADGSRESANLVLGADGIFSQVRQQVTSCVSKNELLRSYLRGIVGLKPKHNYAQEFWGKDGRRFGIDPLVGERCGFYASIGRQEWRRLQNSSLESWKGTWANFDGSVRAVLDSIGSWSELTYDEPCLLRIPKWFNDKAVLIGDAAHAQPPNLGQGANAAMVDAYLFVQMLRKQKNAVEAAQEYQRVRYRFLARTQQVAAILSRLETATPPALIDVRDSALWLAGKAAFMSNWALPYLKGYNRLELEYFSQ